MGPQIFVTGKLVISRTFKRRPHLMSNLLGEVLTQVLRRLEAYLKQGMKKSDAIARLRDSLEPKTGAANDGPLAILSKDE